MNRHPRYTDTALDEIKLLQRLITSSTRPYLPGPRMRTLTPATHMSFPSLTTSGTKVQLASTYAWFSRCSAKVCWASSSGIRTTEYQRLSSARSRKDPTRIGLHAPLLRRYSHRYVSRPYRASPSHRTQTSNPRTCSLPSTMSNSSSSPNSKRL